MAELVDAPDLGSGAERCGGSSPPFRTMGPQAINCVSFVFLTATMLYGCSDVR